MKEWNLLVSDDSGHEYVIPENKETEWEQNQEKYELDGDVPRWAKRKEGTFRFKEYDL